MTLDWASSAGECAILRELLIPPFIIDGKHYFLDLDGKYWNFIFVFLRWSLHLVSSFRPLVRVLFLSFFLLYRGGSGKNLRKVCRKFVPGVIRYPPTKFFPSITFFSSAFSGPTNFFPNMQIFSSQFWRPTHISTGNSHLSIFWPFKCKTFVLIRRSIPRYPAFFLMSFWVFELYKYVKLWKINHFWSKFSIKGQNFSLTHYGKNL